VKKQILINLTAVVALGVFGCNTSRDITHKVGTRTDYAVGQIYALKKPVFLFVHDKNSSNEIPSLEKLGVSGTPLALEEFRREAPSDPQVGGILMPGDQVQVTKFREHSSPTIGKFLDVLAVIITGDNGGKVVELSMISKEGLPSYSVFVNPEYLVPAK
jgi:hypothetical protein